jgi:hypothetical protein
MLRKCVCMCIGRHGKQECEKCGKKSKIFLKGLQASCGPSFIPRIWVVPEFFPFDDKAITLCDPSLKTKLALLSGEVGAVYDGVGVIWVI